MTTTNQDWRRMNKCGKWWAHDTIDKETSPNCLSNGFRQCHNAFVVVRTKTIPSQIVRRAEIVWLYANFIYSTHKLSIRISFTIRSIRPPSNRLEFVRLFLSSVVHSTFARLPQLNRIWHYYWYYMEFHTLNKINKINTSTLLSFIRFKFVYTPCARLCVCEYDTLTTTILLVNVRLCSTQSSLFCRFEQTHSMNK